MRRSRKIILAAVLGVVLLFGSIGGVALAQTENGDDGQPKARFQEFLKDVCDFYNEANPDAPVDCAELEAAFNAAREQRCAEIQQNRPEIDPEAMKETLLERLEERYAAGDITQEQYEKMKERIESMPDDAPFRFGLRGKGGFRGFGGPGGGFHGFGEPPAPTE
jgi:hypothetical protein